MVVLAPRRQGAGLTLGLSTRPRPAVGRPRPGQIAAVTGLYAIAGLTHVLECGPGKVLSGLVKRTLSDVRVYSCETAEQVAAIADELA